MKKIIIFLVSILSINLYSDQLDFNTFIELIKQKLPDFKTSEINVAKAENNIKKENSINDISLSISGAGFGKSPFTDQGDTYIDFSSGFTGSAGLSNVFASGTRLYGGVEYTQVHSWGSLKKNEQPMSFDGVFTADSYDPVIKITIAQPLLYNWFGFLDRFGKKDALKALAIEKMKKELSDDAYMLVYQKLYFTWIQLKLNGSVLIKTIENAKTLEQQTLQKVKNGVAENDDYERVRYMLLQYNQANSKILQNEKMIIKEFSQYINSENFEPNTDEFEIFFQNALSNDYKFEDFDKTKTSALLNVSKERLNELEKVYKNMNMPQLNLFGMLDVKFHKYYSDINPDGYDNIYNTRENYGKVDFTAGLELKHPIGDTKNKTLIAENKLLLDEITNEYTKTRNNYEKNKDLIEIQLITIKENINYVNDKIKSLQSRYETEKKKYSQVRTDTYSLIDTDNSITIEQTNLLSLKNDLISLYLEYLNFVKQ